MLPFNYDVILTSNDFGLETKVCFTILVAPNKTIEEYVHTKSIHKPGCFLVVSTESMQVHGPIREMY